jgi:hypothetical protein
VFYVHLVRSALGELCTRGGGKGDRQWRRWRERAGKQYNSPLRPLYTFWEKDRGLRRGAKSGNGKPTNGQKS